jgi:hypothetical protein
VMTPSCYGDFGLRFIDVVGGFPRFARQQRPTRKAFVLGVDFLCLTARTK